MLLGPRKRLEGGLEVVDLDARWLKPVPMSTGLSVGRCTSPRASNSSPENLSMVRLALSGLESALITQPRSLPNPWEAATGRGHPRRITAVSRIPGIGRLQEVTKGRPAGRFRIRKANAGVCRTQEDTPPTRFGTVRPRVQIPGPRPVSELRCATEFLYRDRTHQSVLV